MNRCLLSSIVLAAVLLVACQPKTTSVEIVSVPGGSYRDVSASELQMTLKSKDFLLINVHIPFAGNIAGTDLSIPYDQIGLNVSRLPPDKDAKIVLYCRSGRMSAIAAESLVKSGYTNIWNLKGGMGDWERAGFGIER
ncbi:MAG: rhodanese-like domain-containing protein [Chloroflexota bacterium]